ncbi:MAG TPA: glycosyltransferase family 9 protein [Bryobacteraceae bacterium]|nr:glycosyltransferase family 9 protein [Bryobacteraceae bacterium]
MESLRTAYLEIWAARPNLPLVRFADRTRSIASTGLDMLEFSPDARLMDELRDFDSIISWYGAARPEFRSAVENLPFQFFTALPPDGAGLHAADFFASQAGCPLPAVPHIDCPRRDGGFAVIHPFAGSARKCWPLDHFRALAARLEARLPVKWCAGPEEPLAEAVRFDDLHELACWLATARVYIGNDSGITHLAAAVGTPVVALFGPTDPRIWAPRGEQVRVVAKASLAGITVDEVASVISNLHDIISIDGRAS